MIYLSGVEVREQGQAKRAIVEQSNSLQETDGRAVASPTILSRTANGRGVSRLTAFSP